MADETKPKLREQSITFSVYCGYGETGRAILEKVRSLASADGRTVSNYVMNLINVNKK